MNEQKRAELLAAVNTLITGPDAPTLFESLRAIIPIAERHPIALTGPAAPLNPLLDLRLKDADAYNRVLDLIARRREEMGYEPLTRPAPTGYDRVEYMRQFMDQKRVRQRTAVEIENMLRPDRDKLIGNARLEFMNRQSAVWKELRDLAIQRAKEENGGRLTKDQTRRVLERFWSVIDAELEARMRHAKAELMKPASARRKPDLSFEALNEALAFDPYKK